MEGFIMTNNNISATTRRTVYNNCAADKQLPGLMACGLSRSTAIGIIAADHSNECAFASVYDRDCINGDAAEEAARAYAELAKLNGASYMLIPELERTVC